MKQPRTTTTKKGSLVRIASSLEAIEELLRDVVNIERGCINTIDIDRGKVYSKHLGKKLTK